MADALALLEARLARLDARIRQAPGQLGLDLGGGQPCGRGHIAADLKCHKGAGSRAPAKPLHPLFRETLERRAREARAKQEVAKAGAQSGEITIEGEGGEPRFRGLKPTRSLGSGAFGTTYQFDTEDGPVVVKVNGLTMGDPAESDPSVGLAEQRANVARREHRNLQRAHAAGLGPEPIGDLTQLPDGRWSLAYRMTPGVKLQKNHQSLKLTEEAAAILADPEAGARFVAGALQLARKQADSGVIHGDLHGGNILVAPDGTPSMIDWAMTRESANPWNEKDRSPAQRMIDEWYSLNPLLAYGMGAEESEVIEAAYNKEGQITIPAGNLAKEAEKAYKAVLDAYDLEWESKNENKVAAKMEDRSFMDRMMVANRLRREGMPFDMALRDPRCGLEPPLTPEVLTRAAAARDAIFGQSQLDEFRRELDRRLGGQA